jgi:hypothetical protein
MHNVSLLRGNKVSVAQQPSIFIAHNHKDKELSERIAKALEFEDMHPRIDFWEVAPGDNFVKWMEEAMSVSKFLVLIWSKNAAESEWVKHEWTSFLPRTLGDKSIKIIPIRIDGTPVPNLLKPISRISYKGNMMEIVVGVSKGVYGLEGRKTHREILAEAQRNAIEAMELGDPFPYVACPICGAMELNHYNAGDDEQGIPDILIVKCTECSFQDYIEMEKYRRVSEEGQEPEPFDDWDYYR